MRRDRGPRPSRPLGGCGYLRGAISVFERDNVHRVSSPYVSLAGVFRRGEAFEIVRRALGEHPEGLDTGELAIRCLEAKGLDAKDKMLRRSMMQTIAQMMQIHRRSGHVVSIAKPCPQSRFRLSAGSAVPLEFCSSQDRSAFHLPRERRASERAKTARTIA